MEPCRRKLDITFDGNPQKDALELCGSINYPNAALSVEALDFGSVLFDTLKTEELVVTNTSEVPVKYHWDLVDVPPDAPSTAGSGKSGDRQPATAPAPPAVHANELFDVKPIKGFLQAGESEAVRVTYCARAGPPIAATAVLNVRGGPPVSLGLRAAPNKIAFGLEPRTLDYGICEFSKVAQRQITLSNPSQCAPHLRLARVWDPTPADFGTEEGKRPS